MPQIFDSTVLDGRQRRSARPTRVMRPSRMQSSLKPMLSVTRDGMSIDPAFGMVLVVRSLLGGWGYRTDRLCHAPKAGRRSYAGTLRRNVRVPMGLRSYLDRAGQEIDADPTNVNEAEIRALSLRHLIEQLCTDVLRRIPRAFGPLPLAMDEAISLRYQELDLYLRQSHAERDLERIGTTIRQRGEPDPHL